MILVFFKIIAVADLGQGSVPTPLILGKKRRKQKEEKPAGQCKTKHASLAQSLDPPLNSRCEYINIF